MAQANPAAALANIYRTPELWQKIIFTLVCLLLYRVGAHITVPGVVNVYGARTLEPGRYSFALFGSYARKPLSVESVAPKVRTF